MLLKAKDTRENTFEPVYWLVRESCKYNMKNNSWPSKNNHEGEAGKFEYLYVDRQEEGSYSLSFKLKSIEAPTDLVIFKSDNEEFPYEMSLNSKFGNGGIDIKRGFSCDGEGLTDKEMTDYSVVLTSTLDLYDATEKAQNRISNPTIGDKLIEVGVKGALCLLLKLEPGQCH